MLAMNMAATDDNFWQGHALPLGGCERFNADSLETVCNYMSSQFCKHSLQTDSGTSQVHFQHHFTKMGNISFHATDYGLERGKVIVDIPLIKDILLVQFSLSGSASIETDDGLFNVSPGQFFAVHSDKPMRQTLAHDYKHMSIKVPIQRIEPLLCRELALPSIDFDLSTKPIVIEGAAESLARMVQTVCEDIESGSSLFRHSRTVNSLEEALIRLMLAVIPHNYAEQFNAPESVAAPYYVRRVEKYISDEVDLEEPVSFEKLIEISGVSARSLHSGFRKFRNTTPMGHLKFVRLNHARKLLLGPVPSGASVTDIAMQSGFTHLSKFSSDYRSMFGELPSETLFRSKAKGSE